MSENSHCRRSGDVSMTPSVQTAQEIAKHLVNRELRGPGDLENAMRRLESKYGIPHSFLWALRYRPPNDILLGAWMTLVTAYQVEIAKQERLLRMERANAEAYTNAVSKAFVSAADALARPQNCEEE